MALSVTKKLADFVVETTFDDLPDGVTEHAKVCILDWIGVALAGSLKPPSRIIASIIREMAGREEAAVIGMGFRTSCPNAALVNGVMGHSVELDDIHEEAIIHPAVPVMPAALVMAEREDVCGKDLITAVTLGYEVEIRIGRAVIPSHYEFWHPTGTCGTFGAAAAAGKLLGLDEKGMVHAFGIAGTGAAGLVEVFGTMSKPFNAGRAAMGGVMAALLAQRGFTSSTRILEAERGYLRATSGAFDIERMTQDLGTDFEAKKNIFKRHASCGHTHGAIDAVLEIVEKHGIKADDISKILVGTYPIAVSTTGERYEPGTVDDAKFSLPYCVAAALIYGKVGLEEFSDEKLVLPTILDLSKRVEAFVDPEFVNARLGPAKVRISTKSGDEHQSRVEKPKGYPENPLTKTELETKFKTLSSMVFTNERIKDLLKTVNNLERMDRIKDLAALICGARVLIEE
jgi:2-methylcitrate dehydratase PrpD